MTLIVSAVAPDGIVMGADSALTETGVIQETAFTGFPKVLGVPRLRMGLSYSGAAQIGRNQTWVSDWIRSFAFDASQAEAFTPFATELADAVNEVALPDALHIFHLAAWVLATDEDGDVRVAPRLILISKGESGRYQLTSYLNEALVRELLAWRPGQVPYPVQILSSGVVSPYAQWMVTTGREQLEPLIGAAIPNPQITALAEFVRFVIRSGAELYRIARRVAYVAEPVETLILFPDEKNMIATRF